MSTHAPQFGQGDGTLSRAAGLVAEARQDFTTMSQQLDGQIAAVHGQWGGRGAQAFFLLHRAWTEKQATVVRALDEFEASLRRTEADNVDTDQTQGSSYQALVQRLG
ncbi:WXG100 family type VII secretion target [Nocardioides panacisoli]|uniref:WXG100 family type VII secretion target n=1 Tax=Nocardioides panacisoli TaxID=627624 RepID=UPI001C62A17D|nr:WXG100 family type VII secretion target [Nocardioides panacisoli]QYJ03665.1 WXG100 family type VII secretion target [Nocardioides panacisoli]